MCRVCGLMFCTNMVVIFCACCRLAHIACLVVYYSMYIQTYFCAPLQEKDVCCDGDVYANGARECGVCKNLDFHRGYR